MEPDFSGYATKADLKCTDGRTIDPGAFRHQDKMTVPLVWHHTHSSPDNVLGHAVLEARNDGVYAYGFFNDTTAGENAKKLVSHGDIKALSIYANQLLEKTKKVLHGSIREVSLVLSGANPGAMIDYVRIAHSDGDVEVLEDEAIITTGLELEHEDMPEEKKETVVEDENLEHAEGQTAQEVYDSFTDPQKELVTFMIAQAIEEAGGAAHSDLGEDAKPQEIYDALSDKEKAVVHSMVTDAAEKAKADAIAEHSADKEGNEMTRNVFETQGAASVASLKHAAMVEAQSKLTPEAIKLIVEDASRLGSLKESFLAHAGDYGIDDIDVLFPDATMDGNGVSIISRRMEWVQNVLSNTKHSPFSRIKSLAADLTADEARAKGYVKGNLKKDEVIKMLKRVTTPKTIYKKQKLDRDDILDVTTIDVVAWLKAEMRVMLDEEIARAVLIGDGRDADDDDKIDEDHIRPVAFDIDMYTTKVQVANNIAAIDLIDALLTAQNQYKGTGQPTFYTTQARLTSMLLAKDTLNRRLYSTKADLAGALLVKDIVAVESMEEEADLVGVLVNLADYTIGADNGGNVAMFDDFDIDFNQQKHLIETRISGALTKPKSAVAIMMDSGHTVTPAAPTFVASTGVLTVPSTTGVVYINQDTNAVLTAGAQTAIAPGATVDVEATPATGYGLTHGVDREWSFQRTP